ncbi:MAG: hypothetical protein U1F46_04840 [Marinagarivorans sp.]
MNASNQQRVTPKPNVTPAVNVWALKKDPNIKSMLLRLQGHLGADRFIIEEDDDLHACGVFLCHTQNADFRAFIFTFGQKPNRYGIHLEYPDLVTTGGLFEAHENISLKSLVEMLAVHFDIAQIHHLAVL